MVAAVQHTEKGNGMDDAREPLFVYFNVLLSNIKIILAGGFACAVLTLAAVMVMPQVYRSSVTLLVRPPLVKSGDMAEMMPESLPVETYKTIAQSHDLVRQVIDRLELEDTAVETLASRLNVQLLQLGERSPSLGTRYSRVLLFTARGTDPELVARIVHEWASLFRERVDSLMWAGVDESVALMEVMYEDSRTALEKAEDSLEQFRREWNLELLAQQKIVKETMQTSLEKDVDDMDIEIGSTEAKLKAIRQELESEIKVETLFKAPPDEVFWLKDKGISAEGEQRIGPDVGLRTEVYNTHWATLRSHEIDCTEQLAWAKEQKQQDLAKIEELTSEILKLHSDIAEQKKVEKRLIRDIDTYTLTYDLVAAKVEKGKIAQAERGDETGKTSVILFAANAVVPETSVSVRRLYKIPLGGIAGTILSVLFVLTREFIRATSTPARESEGPAST